MTGQGNTGNDFLNFVPQGTTFFRCYATLQGRTFSTKFGKVLRLHNAKKAYLYKLIFNFQ